MVMRTDLWVRRSLDFARDDRKGGVNNFTLHSPHFTLKKEKEEDPKAFLCISAFCLTQPRQPEPDGHCRSRKPCKLCGA